jgi:hypothetical protein
VRSTSLLSPSSHCQNVTFTCPSLPLEVKWQARAFWPENEEEPDTSAIKFSSLHRCSTVSISLLVQVLVHVLWRNGKITFLRRKSRICFSEGGRAIMSKLPRKAALPVLTYMPYGTWYWKRHLIKLCTCTTEHPFVECFWFFFFGSFSSRINLR